MIRTEDQRQPVVNNAERTDWQFRIQKAITSGLGLQL